jgi:hypothetical protein
MVNENVWQDMDERDEPAPDGGPKSEAHRYLRVRPVVTVEVYREGRDRPVRVNAKDVTPEMILWDDRPVEETPAEEPKSDGKISRRRRRKPVVEETPAEETPAEEPADEEPVELPDPELFGKETEFELNRLTVEKLSEMPEAAYVEKMPKAKKDIILAIVAVRAEHTPKE